ncbi:MAG TPA: N-acetylneuraminate synthase family protein [Terriglobales bacterium]|nr:N-acetylneuraminate synthase family protein [Terriglobales bacterium]
MQTMSPEMGCASHSADGCPSLTIAGRKIGAEHPPLVIAEIGINHEGNLAKAITMVEKAAEAGCECVKFQAHIIEDEMIPNDVVPGNARESIWDIMKRCALSEDEDAQLQQRVEELGIIYLSTPFSRAAAERLERLDVLAYKIGSGECNNYPLIEHIASFGKPVLLSTGMNDLPSIALAVDILRRHSVPFAVFHCTSMYPTPYDKVRLGALAELRKAFPDAVLGLSDHSLGNYTCYGAVALGASIVEKHFTADKNWPGPDIEISMDPTELRELIIGTRAVHQALGGKKTILPEEQPTMAFAYACVVTTKDVPAGAQLNAENIWVKRPGSGEIKAVHYSELLGRQVNKFLPRNTQLKWADLL